MTGGKPPPSFDFTTAADMGANYGGGGGGTPHVGGSYSPNSAGTPSTCPTSPGTSSSHTFTLHNNHFQQQERIGDPIASTTPRAANGLNGQGQRGVGYRGGRGGGRGGGNWHHQPFFMPPPPPFGPFLHGHGPPFPPGPPSLPPHGPPFNRPPPFMNNGRSPRSPPHFFVPPPFHPNQQIHIDTSIPPPPYSNAPHPFFMGPPPPPPHPSFFHGGYGQQHGHSPPQSPPQQRQTEYEENRENRESRPASREERDSLASTQLSFIYTEEDSSDTWPEEESFTVITEPPPTHPDVIRGKRSYLIKLRPHSMRDWPPGQALPYMSIKEFYNFIHIFTGVRTSGTVNEKCMDSFIEHYMKIGC